MEVKLGLKNLAMLPAYFDYIFVHLRQKVGLRPELSPKFLSTLGSNPARTWTRPEKPDPIYNYNQRICVGRSAETKQWKRLFHRKFYWDLSNPNSNPYLKTNPQPTP